MLRRTAAAVAIAGIVGAGLVGCDDSSDPGLQCNSDKTSCEPGAPAQYMDPAYPYGVPYGVPSCSTCPAPAGTPGRGSQLGYGNNGSAGATQGGG